MHVLILWETVPKTFFSFSAKNLSVFPPSGSSKNRIGVFCLNIDFDFPFIACFSAATEADTGDEDSALLEKIQDKVAAEKAKVSVTDKEELFKVGTNI